MVAHHFSFAYACLCVLCCEYVHRPSGNSFVALPTFTFWWWEQSCLLEPTHPFLTRRLALGLPWVRIEARHAKIHFYSIVVSLAARCLIFSLFFVRTTTTTTTGPLVLVISVSLLVEGFSDYKRHLNDHETNNAPCVILRRSDELEADTDATRDMNIYKGKDVVVDMNKSYAVEADLDQTVTLQPANPTDPSSIVRVAFQKVRRKEIRQGHFVLVKNREMVPADIVLLASSNDQGGAYIETSSIDGETNLKLRMRPSLPKSVIKALRDGCATRARGKA